MTKRVVKTTINNIPTELIKSRTDFNSELDKRIELGNELIKRIVNTPDDFNVLRSDYSNWNDYNSEYLKHAFNKEFNEYKKRYDDAGSFNFAIISTNRTKSPYQELQDFRSRIDSKLDNLIKLKLKSELLKSSIEEKNGSQIIKNEKNLSEVFIVHGHDDEAKIKTARFVEKLGFKPIILHEQASGSKTVIEKIETYSNVGFGIVLYTPCDTGAKKEDDPKYKNRARQNVVFEHGFLIGKIGRQNVCALVKDDIETPNDISGVVYIKMDVDDAWQLKLARELRNSGYEVDMNKL
ncbi:putative nucleotide-binding protein [Flavobacterium arsenatis]|uniref:Nucleotide-binding protein n=1 Tax=Flavobacterium arsenatis TaxID=1484332 RepID=A0ABU1TP20_9FLAO|nr:nucleotide-binding protein [Flavobacterium arsenatis]MDR6967695.1 putative nucleotide-binding protein [Flavobacterium arsenatis]